MTMSKAIGMIDTPLNKKKIAQFEDEGVKVLKFPQAIIERVADCEPLLEIARDLSRFDWIIFTDIHTADIFLEIIQENDLDLFELDDLVVCALGEAVVDRLRFMQVHSDVIPASKDDETVLSTIENYVSVSDEFHGAKVLFLKRQDLDLSVGAKLLCIVGELVKLDVYKTDALSTVERARITTLLQSGAIDEFVFCSPDDVESLSQIVYPKSLREILGGISISATDPITFQTLREQSLKPQLANRS